MNYTKFFISLHSYDFIFKADSLRKSKIHIIYILNIYITQLHNKCMHVPI